MDPNTQKAKDKERRRAKRFKTPVDIQYRTLTQNPIYGNVRSSDISKGGVSFTDNKDIKTGTSVELRMNVPGDNIPVFATGTVSWAQGLKTGVKINPMKKIDQTKIFEYIYKEWLKSRGSGRTDKSKHKKRKTHKR